MPKPEAEYTEEDWFNVWRNGYFSWVEEPEMMPKDLADLFRMCRDAFEAGVKIGVSSIEESRRANMP